MRESVRFAGESGDLIHNHPYDRRDYRLPAREIDPPDSRILPKLVGDGAKDPVMRTTPGSSHFRFIGVEITPTPAFPVPNWSSSARAKV